MLTVKLGRTGITINKNAFGALPIQRISKEDAVRILRKALDNGIALYDSAHVYTDSEEKLGEAFHGVDRSKYYIATKAMAKTVEDFNKQLELSLKRLRTDYIDIYQFHNPLVLPKPGDETGLYDAMQKAKQQGKLRFFGISSHRLPVAMEAVKSGLYDSLQFPFSYLSSDDDIALVKTCKEHNVAFIAMKSLSGGIITNAKAAYAWMSQFDNVAPIWGIQRESELDEFIAFDKNPPALTDELKAVIDADRKELSGDFCRGCAYCEPCPAGIPISTAARMMYMIRRMPSARHLTPEIQESMSKIENCIHCGYCKEHCPYGLDASVLLEKNYADYKEILAGKPL